MVADQTLLAHARAEKCMQPIVFCSGSSIGEMVFAPILSYVLSKYGLEAKFILEAAVTAVVCFTLGMLLKTPPNSQPAPIDKEEISMSNRFQGFLSTTFDKRIVCNKGYIFYTFGMTFSYFLL